jgi:hypothetical protein
MFKGSRQVQKAHMQYLKVQCQGHFPAKGTFVLPTSCSAIGASGLHCARSEILQDCNAKGNVKGAPYVLRVSFFSYNDACFWCAHLLFSSLRTLTWVEQIAAEGTAAEATRAGEIPLQMSSKEDQSGSRAGASGGAGPEASDFVGAGSGPLSGGTDTCPGAGAVNASGAGGAGDAVAE